MDFTYFFLHTEKAISENLDVGFEHFSPEHLIWLLATSLAAYFIAKVYKASNKTKRSRIKKILALYLLISEIAKDALVLIVGANIMDYLPLHLCSFAIAGLMADAYIPNQKITGQLIAYAFAPGATAALLFSNWTVLPVFLNIFSIQSFIFHGVIVIYFVMKFASGEIDLCYSGIWKSLAMMITVAIPVLLFDMMTDRNYLFIYKVQENSPLEFIWDIFGTKYGLPGYLAGYLALAIVVLHICFLFYRSISVRRRNIRKI